MKRGEPDVSGYDGQWSVSGGSQNVLSSGRILDYLLRKPIYSAGVGDISETSGLYNSSRNVTILPLEMRADYGVQQMSPSSLNMESTMSLTMFKVGFSAYINIVISLKDDIPESIKSIGPQTDGHLIFPKGWAWKVFDSLEIQFPSTNVNSNTYNTRTIFLHSLLTSRDVQKDLILGMGGQQLNFKYNTPNNYSVSELSGVIMLPLPWSQMNPDGSVPVDTEVFPSAPQFTFNTARLTDGLCFGDALDNTRFRVETNSYKKILAQAQTVTLSAAQSSIGKDLRLEAQRGNNRLGGLVYPFLNCTSAIIGSLASNATATFNLGTLLNADLVRIIAAVSRIGNTKSGVLSGQGETLLFEDDFESVELNFNTNPFYRYKSGTHVGAMLPYFGRDEGFEVQARLNPAEWGVNRPVGAQYAIGPVQSRFFSFPFTKDNSFEDVHKMQNVPRYFGQEFTLVLDPSNRPGVANGAFDGEAISLEVFNYYEASYVLNGQDTQLLMSGYVARPSAIPLPGIA